jgi:phosphoribosylaminoimidazolecarboxamide formyltransferase/IMP cyclohydrolase
VSEIRRALLSVSDKSGLAEFAQGLENLGIELFASGGTAKVLREAGLQIKDILDYAESSEMLGGRVKTLQPKLHAAILARRDNSAHMDELRSQDIALIDLVVVNLYPFEAQVNQDTPVSEAMEFVDIGGEALIRAAAKNHEFVGVVVNPADYDLILRAIQESQVLSADLLRDMAEKAFQHITHYNSVISNWFLGEEPLQGVLDGVGPKQIDLRYGENPHQHAALYSETELLKQLQGKELSYINVIDSDAAFRCVGEFESPTAVIIKHSTPCGVASADDILTAFSRAYEADPKSAFGGIIGLNRDLDGETARKISEQFFEVVIAPRFSNEALDVLSKKKNLRLIEFPTDRFDNQESIRSTVFGVLKQSASFQIIERSNLKVMTSRTPTELEFQDAVFGWKVCKHVLSNAIVLASNERTLGIGGGQVNRVDAARIAIEKAGERASGSVLASDAFIPFPDTVNLAAASGVKVIIQTGGSVRDEEVIQCAEEQNISMIFTGIREFRH